MKIVHATSELFPYSKTGGLADMVDGLAKALARRRHRVSVITPLYRGIAIKHKGLVKTAERIHLPMGSSYVQANVWIHEPEPNLSIYFIDQPDYYQRDGLYNSGGKDYPDNAARFIFFSKCVAHLSRLLQPRIVHVHDWQVGMVPLFIDQERGHDDARRTPKTVLTIHNLAFQGLFGTESFPLTNLPWSYYQPGGVEFYGHMNCLKSAIVFSDYLTTVSPQYAWEITGLEQGCGLDGVLRERQHVLAGILNGVDYNEWRTTGNPHLQHPYTVDDLKGKDLQKSALQKEFGLPPIDVPLFGVISRLSEQKGIDIELAALQEMLSEPMQFVLLGSGDPAYTRAFADLAMRHPEKVSVRFGFDQSLSHRIEAGSDFFLMPSRYEPCGLNQMYSLRYGTIPIVRATGGLNDSVIDIREDVGKANGIKFHEYSSVALANAIRKAITLYQHSHLRRHYQTNGMRADFSWETTSRHYEELYEKIS